MQRGKGFEHEPITLPQSPIGRLAASVVNSAGLFVLKCRSPAVLWVEHLLRDHRLDERLDYRVTMPFNAERRTPNAERNNATVRKSGSPAVLWVP
jgi:hypothetical protein